MNIILPLSTVDFFARQVNLDGLQEIGRSALQTAFGSFIDKGMAEEDKVQRREEIVNFFGGEEVFPGSEIGFDLNFRRFAGDQTLSRGRYYSIAKDREGHDAATLLHELLAYYRPTEPGWVSAFDLAIPEHQDVVLSRSASLPEDQLREFDLDGPAIVIAFFPLNGQPHPFAARYTDKVYPFFVTIPTAVERIHMDRVIDLRSPDVALWFTNEMTRWRAVDDEEELDLIPAKTPLHRFQDLIPTLLEQSLGGASRALTTSAGLRLRQLDVNGLIFPSARADSVLKLDRGRVVENTGWNFVDYRNSAQPETFYAIDMDSHWPMKVGFQFATGLYAGQQMPYEDVSIKYTEHSAATGSWSVSGLSTWQEAWFRARCALSALEAKDPELFDDIGPSLNSLWLQAKSGAWLLEVSDVIFGAILETEKDLIAVQEWVRNFADAGETDLADSLQKLVDAVMQ